MASGTSGGTGQLVTGNENFNIIDYGQKKENKNKTHITCLIKKKTSKPASRFDA